MRRQLLYSVLFIFSVFLADCMAADEAVEVTLTEAVRLALQRHPDVEKARSAAEGLAGRIREARAQAFPDISINSNALRLRDPSLLNASGLDKFPIELRNALVPSGVNLFDYSINIKQPLYTAGKVGTALRLASLEAQGASIDIKRAEQDLSLAVVRAFYDLVWAERYRDLVVETQEQRKKHAEMARSLYRNGVATEVDVLRSEVNVANGAPDLVRAENTIRQARALLNFYLVRPIDFQTRAMGEFEEKAGPEEGLERLTGQALQNRPELLRLLFMVNSFPGEPFEGRVREISPAVDAETRAAKVRIQLNNSRGRLKAGMFVQGEIVTGAPSQAIVIPAAAVYRDDRSAKESFVFVVENGQAVRRRVRIGQEWDQNLQIVQGLKPGDLLVAELSIELAEGVHVKPRW
jgi:multidrug efflux pump subunit AcrA (membrane-fusion protein)